MTGEVTLRGRVLPVGGVREKALAAVRSGIHTIVLPERNMRDAEEIPKELKRRIKFIPVKHMTQILEMALERQPRWNHPVVSEHSASLTQGPSIRAHQGGDDRS